jgi:hypothetical protein
MNGAPGVVVVLGCDGVEFYIPPFSKYCEGWGTRAFWTGKGRTGDGNLGGEGLFEVGDQVVGVFDAYGES